MKPYVIREYCNFYDICDDTYRCLRKRAGRKFVRAIEIFPAPLVIGFFRLQFRGARQQQLKSDNDSPSTETIPTSSLPQLFALFASPITNLVAKMWAHMSKLTAVEYLDIVGYSTNMYTTQSL